MVNETQRNLRDLFQNMRLPNAPRPFLQVVASCVGASEITHPVGNRTEERTEDGTGGSAAWEFMALVGDALVHVVASSPHADWELGDSHADEDARFDGRVIPLSEVRECRVDGIRTYDLDSWDETWTVFLRVDQDGVRIPQPTGGEGRAAHSELGRAIAALLTARG